PLGPVADIPQVDFDEPPLNCQFQEALREIALEEVGKQSENVEAHGRFRIRLALARRRASAKRRPGHAGGVAGAAAASSAFFRCLSRSAFTFSDANAPTLIQ